MRYHVWILRCLVVAVLAWLVAVDSLRAGPPPEDLVKKLTARIREHCPDATIEVSERGFLAKNGTLMFTIHNRSKTGEVFPQTHQEEGPNYKGFVLHVARIDGKYEGAAVVPQTLSGPYYQTYIDAVPATKENSYYWVSLSFGSRLDEKLKKVLFDAIPRTEYRRDGGPAKVEGPPAAGLQKTGPKR